MASCGIYTLANDVVFDQLVAFLNSVEVNVSPDIPVCIIPYDDRMEQVQKEIGDRPNVSIYEDQQEIQRWEDFAKEVWLNHPLASEKSDARLVSSRIRFQIKMVAFQGDFDKFVFYDADTLAMKPVDDIFLKLDTYDFVFNDWEHAKTRLTALDIPRIEATGELTESQIRPKLHCSSFFASQNGLFSTEEVNQLKNRLIQNREIEWINGISDAFLFSYLTLRGYSIFNYTLSPNGQDRTGNCADADPFVNQDNVLYNEQGLKPIHRIHYMNFSAADFARVSKGEDVNIPHRDVFLHYRFLKQPNAKPSNFAEPDLFTKIGRFKDKALKKIKRAIT
ncbi:Npun_R2821/Npun_R2822 family protein [Arthrospira platensis]|jgi:hypothetical protein|uniref:Methionine synthase n=1 Tax=Limnospira platensis NIES-46 TaxID=1236695 RepID=A0A5M3TD03_LIMPL|nr:Npun_R2821/Npun_R2822 family protein [Arthrospira platensis]AMW27515.1 methionine synthase [Arthrospira platensis YZ]KDR55882.1 methionine synthase [Arthrospira platensis str. Paraca]MBD2670859.1 methionine synthase [Arthrospira platensis FACHB-439]MBD2711570.1 methionine synthase [Arthrospira platensis FACHB-835]MDF2210076.1 methionine synthase [Arthrospira platensis NCB002]MDT9184049.1 methionine synthase [Limnospira sp. PMC 289.06]MDT9296267.1 methionine synthase [Arthrospira platensis